jgi:hypothetical protein
MLHRLQLQLQLQLQAGVDTDDVADALRKAVGFVLGSSLSLVGRRE